MTNNWTDYQNSDCFLIIGGNPAENHPISFKWIEKAKEERGAKVISVDPRFTRSSSKADLYVPMRAGTDIAFIGAIINYVLENELYDKEYVANYTNASFLVNEGFSFEDGLFSGYDEEARSYDTSSWSYQKEDNGDYKKDLSLEHPQSVFQLLKEHYSRYDLDKAARVTGASRKLIEEVAETLGEIALDPSKTSSILYAMGTTQHTFGTQNVRSYAMLQLLLGNVGKPGGGVNAMRGKCNVQGSTDMALLNHILPGYLGSPVAAPEYATLEDYLEAETPDAGFWVNTPNFFVSQLKAFWGDAADEDNDFAYHYLSKRKAGKDYSHIGIFEDMYQGKIKGLFAYGQNIMVDSPNLNRVHEAMKNLDWLVVADPFETETAAFWKEEAGVEPETIDTEVFLLPTAVSFEKEGSYTDSGRVIQWKWKAVDPPGEAKEDLWIIDQLFKRIREQYQGSDKEADKPILELDWDYGATPDANDVAREINGYDTRTGKPIAGFGNLKDDGTTASGNWIYCGMFTEDDENRTKSRDNSDPSGMGVYPNWAFAWPANRRIIYNRASADLDGKPWHSEKAYIWWDGSEWTGYDVPDFGPTVEPDSEAGRNPFIMRPEGVGCIFALRAEGPFPEHYEPYESPTENQFSSVQYNPAVKLWDGSNRGEADDYPYVATTYRLSEHYQSGAMSRNIPWLAELVPELFVEIGTELAAQKGIKSGDKVEVSSIRGKIEAKALVTPRVKTMLINGKRTHHVGIPWHFGYKGLVTGGSGNILTPTIGDANTTIPEYKGFLVNVRRLG
ncbi:formate dehydrogenase-N subunit alpha [Natroniella sulfidigena]|nr:formate dehydrogenase-N subunit alpha [Natroniella sulfidigena]